MKIDDEIVQRWLDAYNHAWTTYDPYEIGSLFTDDAEYRWHPWDERDELVQDDVAIAVGMTFYYTDATQGTLDRAYHNLWVLRFSDARQCRSFTEWYMQAPGTP